MGQVADDTDTQAAYSEVIAGEGLNASESASASADESADSADEEE